MYLVFRAQNFDLWTYQDMNRRISTKRTRFSFSAGPIKSLNMGQDQVSILKGGKTRRQCQVVELGWMEEDRSPRGLDRSQRDTVQCKVKPGRSICYFSSCCRPYFFPAAAGNGVLSPWKNSLGDEAYVRWQKESLQQRDRTKQETVRWLNSARLIGVL